MGPHLRLLAELYEQRALQQPHAQRGLVADDQGRRRRRPEERSRGPGARAVRRRRHDPRRRRPARLRLEHAGEQRPEIPLEVARQDCRRRRHHHPQRRHAGAQQPPGQEPVYRDVRMRIEPPPDGSAKGLVGGYQDVSEQWRKYVGAMPATAPRTTRPAARR